MATNTDGGTKGPDTDNSLRQQDRKNLSILSRWTAPLTNRLLSSLSIAHNEHRDENNDELSYVLLDNVMESEFSGNLQIDDEEDKDDGANKEHENRNFCDALIKELGVFLDKLTPARTTGDKRADDIMELLQSMGTQLSDQEGQSQTQQQPVSSFRGDKSIFISREYRQQQSFATKHPYLHRLIHTVSNTFDQEFNKNVCNENDSCSRASAGNLLKLDFSMTSVQVALYPGDTKSGYRRHCDRENQCKLEPLAFANENAYANEASSNSNDDKPQRLITAIYYLTDDDWNDELDGGALRIFHGDESSEKGSSLLSSSLPYTDVIPYRDRLVVFRSDRVEHQVMPSHRRQRLAITIWFYGIVHKTNSVNDADFSFSPTVESSSHSMRSQTAITNGAHPPRLSTSTIEDIHDENDSVPSIFVSIASFRDSETRPTINDMYSKALKPERVFVGTVVQLLEGEKGDEDIWESIVGSSCRHAQKASSYQSSKPRTPHSHQIRYIRLNARDATGPCYARGLCQSLYRGEDYILQIDSHMRFRQGWDEYLIQTIEKLQEQRQKASTVDEGLHSDKIVLTTYPVGYELPNKIPNETRGTYLVPLKFDNEGMLRQRGRLLVSRKRVDRTANAIATDHTDSDMPLRKQAVNNNSAKTTCAHRQYLYAGGFNFGPARLIHDVPYDTMGLHHLFFGEELSMAVRLFTHGYDLYAPVETVCYHLWSRAHRPTTTTEMVTEAAATKERKQQLLELSRAKVMRQLLGDESMIGKPYGLGTTRTAAAFADNLGVDFHQRTFVLEGWECGELCSEDFVGHSHGNQSLLFPEDSLGSKVRSLDSKPMELIGSFLQGLTNSR